MLFNNKKLNLILNKLLTNNKYARANVISFFKSLPEEIASAIFACRNIIIVGKDCYFTTLFEADTLQLDMVFNNSMLNIYYYLVNKDEIENIPLDNHNDIFFSNNNINITSPAFFNIVYNPNMQQGGETLEYEFYIVKKQINNKTEYYLVSQSNIDAGVYCSKVDVEDFIADDSIAAEEEPNVGGENFE